MLSFTYRSISSFIAFKPVFLCLFKTQRPDYVQSQAGGEGFMSAGHRSFIMPSLSMRQTSPSSRQHWDQGKPGRWGRARPPGSRRMNAPCGQTAPKKDGCSSAKAKFTKCSICPTAPELGWARRAASLAPGTRHKLPPRGENEEVVHLTLPNPTGHRCISKILNSPPPPLHPKLIPPPVLHAPPTFCDTHFAVLLLFKVFFSTDLPPQIPVLVS